MANAPNASLEQGDHALPPESRLRLATPGDAPALAALVNSAYRGDSSRAGWTTEADLLGGQRTDADMLWQTLEQPGNVILLLETGARVLGCVQLERSATDAHLGMLTVTPDRQGGGIGRRLLAAAERFALGEWQAQHLHMTVIVQRVELIDWYEKRGYRPTGERRPFPYGDERFGLPRRGDLEFLVLSKRLGQG